MFEIVALMLLSQQPLQPLLEGEASYYTVQSSSAVTASGEALRDDSLSCAMRLGEFGEKFLVVTQDGKSVVVTLNDRGPFVDDRVIDLSEAAMRKLDPSKGLLQVKVYRLGSKKGPLSTGP
ncbi:MAG: hypothetical protein HYV27_09460 [Candidatus Hydrogenedentes bacterium]|nr:hypothetical protein [Candidatus Hydrogenedentota bacterium]